MSDKRLYRINFLQQGKVYEVYARGVSHGAMVGFVEVEDFVFGERSSLVVDPSEEKIKSEFEGVKRSFLPLHAVLRIDEVQRSGTSKITDADGSNVSAFPQTVYTPGGGD